MADLQSNENELGFVVNARLDEFRKEMAEYDSRLIHMERKTKETTNSMGNMFEKMGKLFGAYMSYNAIQGFVRQVINVRGEFQKLEIAFDTMLGSQEKANALMKQLTDTAARTPFDLQSVSQGAKQLLAYGTNAEEVNDTLVRLGNIASGLSIPLGDMVQLYGTTQVQGRIFTQDLRQFMGRGIPLAKELAKQFNTTESAIQQMVTDGKIGFNEVRKALENLTNEGGMFYNLMEKQSASLSGQISNLDDAFTSMLNEIGTATQDTLSKGISAVAWAVENYKKLGETVMALVATYGTYKTALLLSITIEKRAVAMRLAHIKLIKLQTMAQTALNAVSKVNPYVAIATAVVGIASMLYIWRDRTDQQAEAQARLNEKMKDFDDKQKETYEKTQQLIEIIQDKTKAIWEQVDAYNELQKYSNVASGKSIEEVRTMNAENAMTKQMEKNVVDKIAFAEEKLKEAQANLEKVLKPGGGVEKGWEKYDKGQVTGAYLKYFEDVKSAQANLDKLREESAKRQEQLRFEALSDEEKLLELGSKRAVVQAQIDAEGERMVQIEKEMADNNALYDPRISLARANIANLRKELEGYQAQMDAISGKNSTEAKDYIYWQGKQKEALDEFHKHLPGTKEFNEAKKNYEIATKEMEKWDLKVKEATESIKDLLKRWKDLAKETARENELMGLAEFDKRKKQNEYDLEDKLQELKTQKDTALKRTDLTKSMVAEINKTYDEAVESAKRAFNLANKQIEDEERNYLSDLYHSLAEYQKSELDNTLDSIEKDAEQRLKEIEVKFGKESSVYKKSKGEIDWLTSAQKEDATVQSLINKEQRMSDIRVKQIELTKNLRGEAQAELDMMYEKEESLKRQIQLMENQKHGLTEAEQMQLDSMRLQLKQLQADREKFELQLRDMRALLSEMFSSIGGSLGNSSNANMEAFGKYFQYMGSAMSSSKSIAQKYQSGDRMGAYSEGIATAMNGTIEMFNLVYDQVQANKEALRQWDLALQASALKLEMLEFDEYAKTDQGVLEPDNPYKKLQKSLDNAQKAYELSIKSLDELGGKKVKTGTEKVYDLANTLKGMGIGTSIGAAIGTMIYPGLGTAIGAGVGQITGTLIGLFGGKKVVDVYNTLENEYGAVYDKETLEINKKILADYDKMDEATKRLIDHTKELLEARKEAMEEFRTYVGELTGDIGGALNNSLVNAFSNDDLYSAVDDFKDYVKERMESVISQQVFSSVFGDTIDALERTLTEGIIDEDGNINGSIEEKLAIFPGRITNLLGTYDTLMKAYQDAFSQGGYDLFKSQAEVVQDALQGTIASMSEDTATKLNGNFMGLKLSAMEINMNVGTMKNLATEANDILTRSMNAMNRIADNTSWCERLQRLDQLADDINEIKRTGIVVR